MFLASFLSLGLTGRATQDSWGNIKIPLLEDINSTDITSGWREVSHRTDVQYSSVVGIPISVPHGEYSTTFIMQSWYWQLDNATLWNNKSTGPLLTGTSEFNGSYLLKNFTGKSGLWQFATPNSLNPEAASSIPITFQVAPAAAGFALHNSLNVTYTYGSTTAPISPSAVRLDAVLTQRPVELNVTCTASSCNVTAIRDTITDASYDSALDRSYVVNDFLPHITQAFPSEHLGTPVAGVLEAYLFDPLQNPYNVLSATYYLLDLTQIDAEKLSRRLSQVLNAYWIVDNEFVNAAGGFNASDPGLAGKGAIRNSSVAASTDQDFLYGDSVWVAIFCISILVMMLIAIASAVLSYSRLTPDYTDLFSALTLTDGRMMLDSGSSLDEYQRIRLFKDFKLKIGDVMAEEQIGKVIIGQDGEVGDLKKERLYW